WRSDCTAAGTCPILDRQVFGIFRAGDGHVWFAGQDAGGVELWSTDGTAAGTGLFAELHPGEVSSQPADFAASTGRLLFAAAHPALGREPWVLPLGATAQPVGHACVASHRLPRLEGDPPVLGTTFGLRVRQGPTLGFGVMLASLHTTSSFRLPGGRCDLFLDPGFVVLAIAGLNGGGFDVPWTLPADPAFAGLPLRAQSLLFPNGGLTDVEATNAVSLVTGL
ncbi:MAG: hypothetical protein KDE27_01425, partial [Planctomycetes bacterium]|nr:hypothetical protein [Planctomycetota bacterium]